MDLVLNILFSKKFFKNLHDEFRNLLRAFKSCPKEIFLDLLIDLTIPMMIVFLFTAVESLFQPTFPKADIL